MDYLTSPKNRKRLVVLIPDCLANNTDLARRIHWMADRERLDVLYLVLVDNDEIKLDISRRMATMRAVTSANRLAVETKLVNRSRWLQTLCKISSPSDVIVVQEEQTVVNRWIKKIHLSDFLSKQLSVPVYTISGYYPPLRTQVNTWLFQIFSILGFLAILAVFGFLEIELDLAFQGPIQKIFLMIVVCVEVGAIVTWHKFTYR